MATVRDSQSHKRKHETFEELADIDEPCSVTADYRQICEEEELNGEGQEREREQNETLPTPPVSAGEEKRAVSPALSSMSELTELGAITPPRGLSPEIDAAPQTMGPPSAFAKLKGTGPPPSKKVKMTFTEKKRLEKEAKDREKAAEKPRKDAQKKAKADAKEAEKKAVLDEKARKEAERKAQADAKEAERKIKDAEREEKRAAKEAEKAALEEKRRKKEEEKQKKEEEKRKKERSQLRLGNFFAIPTASNRSRTTSVESTGRRSMSPALQNPNSGLAALVANLPTSTPAKSQRTPYEQLFPEFYKRDDVTLAPISRFQRDEEALENVEKTIDGYLVGNKAPDTQLAFDPLSLFHLEPSQNLKPRGKHYISVRDIMSDFNTIGSSKMAIDLTTTDSQNSQIKRTSELLKKIPMKILSFREDVRPPYKGTYTKRPLTSATKLARNPLRRDLPNTDYDYDSEAEWVEDEDGEDLKSDGEDEEDVDDGEDMDGFLDDEGDEMANSRRLVIQGDLEPISTGLCWEDRTKRNMNATMMEYRMEIILGMSFASYLLFSLTLIDPKIKSLDPFSTSYWQPAPSIASMEPPRLPLNTLKTTSVTVNGKTSSSKPVKPFFPPASSTLSTASSTGSGSTPESKDKDKDGKPKKLLPAEDLPAFKAALVGSDLSKVGLIEVLKKKFPGRPGMAIKNTLEAVAKRGNPGEKEKDKRWVLLDP
jgi:chromatin assembly factor 1 subunit A